jgi:rod shape-determining protein MreC
VANLRNKRLLVLSISLGSAILISGLLAFLKSPFLTILNYPLKIVNYAGRELQAIIYYHRNYLENKKLREGLGFLKERLSETEELRLENARLRDLLSFKKKSSHHLVAARVIGRDPSYWSSVIIIDKGRSSGVRKNSAVISPGGLVGKVIETAKTTAKVMLILDPDLSVSAIVQRSRQEGLVSGTLQKTLIMRYISPEADVKTSDIIITSGLSSIYPKGIVIGEVVKAGKEFLGLSCYCLIRPAVDFWRLEEVLVVSD